jgi:hypothetical protein
VRWESLEVRLYFFDSTHFVLLNEFLLVNTIEDVEASKEIEEEGASAEYVSLIAVALSRRLPSCEDFRGYITRGTAPSELREAVRGVHGET